MNIRKEDLCFWCEAEMKSRNNHCDLCYPLWRKAYNSALVYHRRHTSGESELRYTDLFNVHLILQGFKAPLPRRLDD